MIPKLTVGAVVYDDYDGLYFTLQAIRMYHPEILNEVEFVIIDNNPTSASGKAVESLTKWIKQPIQYLPFDEYKSTAVRDLVFWKARTDYVLCTDCHVLFEPGSLRRLIDFFKANRDEGNLLQGPLVYDDMVNLATHFEPVWRARMWGTWATDERGKNRDGAPFEIPMQGLGAFACRKHAWPGFNAHFRGFGGEEGYIHEKFRLAGKRTLCLPFLRWIHRFGRPNGVPYPLKTEDRVINYFIGHLELGMDTKPIHDHFKEFHTADDLIKMETFAKKELGLL